MDFKSLKKKIILTIEALEVTHDKEGLEELAKILDNFIKRKIIKAQDKMKSIK
jgi:ribosomal protein S20